MNRIRLTIFGLLVLALAFGAFISCSGDDDDDQSQESPSDDDTTTDDDATDDDTAADDDTIADDDTVIDDDTDQTPTLITVSGNAFAFPNYERIVGAEISILEFPDKTTTTVEDGYFEFDDLPAGEQATFVIDADGFVVTQTKTFTLPEEDLERVTFQVPDNITYLGLALALGIVPSRQKCQIVTTVTMVGRSIYDEGAHGKPGATVSSDPLIPSTQGPVYFDDNVLPDRDLTQSSTDGGVLYYNVDPGVYTLSAEKTGVEFESVTLNCRKGVLVNASPPYGLQALEQ